MAKKEPESLKEEVVRLRAEIRALKKAKSRLLTANKTLLTEIKSLEKRLSRELGRPRMPRGYTYDASGMHPPGSYGL